LEEIQLNAEPDLVIMLIGNKLDLVEKNPSLRRVLKENATSFARENGLLFEETSAYNSININDSFQRLVE
jgi:Rab family protein